MASHEPVQIISFYEDNFSIKTDVLEAIVQQNGVKDKKVCVVSIVGSCRQGKSFLLNFLLRYLRLKYRSSNWLKSEDGPIDGFSWKAGSARHTTGILMWPEIFLSLEDEVAIILLDCQGLESTRHQDLAISALGTFLSSVLIYNLKEGIKQYDLSNLKCFAEHARRCLDQPHQKLLFLIRDWPYCNEYSYGEDGGRQFLQTELATNDKQTLELTSLKNFVKSSFDEVGCFLVPHPGRAVATSADSHNNIDELDDEFKQYVEELVPTILAPDKLVPKVVKGRKITVGELIELLGQFQKELIEEKSTVKIEYKASANVQHKKAFDESIAVYEKLMSPIRNRKTDVLTKEQLSEEHEEAKTIAVDNFRGKVKQGDRELNREYETKLEKELETKFEDYQKFNELKYRNQKETEEIEKLKEAEKVREEERHQLEEAIKELQEKGRKLLKQQKLWSEQEKQEKETRRSLPEDDLSFHNERNGDDENGFNWNKIKKTVLYYGGLFGKHAAVLGLVWLTFNNYTRIKSWFE